MSEEEPEDPAGEAGAGPCPVRAAIDHLCQELNLDGSSATEALREFTALRGTYSLEVLSAKDFTLSVTECNGATGH